MFRSIFYVFFFLFCATASVKAQDFLPAAIVLNNEELKTGHIKYFDWLGNPGLIIFRSDSGSTEKLDPLSIRSFTITREDGERIAYQSATVHYESGVRTSLIQPADEVSDTVFLRVLVKGRVSLYLLKLKGGKDKFFLQQTGQPITYLNQQEYVSVNGNENNLRTTDQYKRQLLEVLKECPGFKPVQVIGLSYTEKSLTAAITQYNSCFDRTQPDPKKSKTKTEVYVLGGLQSSTLLVDFASSGRKALCKGGAGLAGGAGIQLFIKGLNKRLGLGTELFATNYDVASEKQRREIFGGWEEYQYQFAFTRVRLNLKAEWYFFKRNDFRMSVLAGISDGINIQSKNSFVLTSNVYNIEYTSSGEAVESPREYEQGFFGGLSLNYKRLGFQVRHERANGFSYASSIQTAVRSFYFVACYVF